MEKDWYYISDRRRGPIPESNLKKLFSSGKLPLHTRVWTESMTFWTAAANIEMFCSLSPTLKTG